MVHSAPLSWEKVKTFINCLDTLINEKKGECFRAIISPSKQRVQEKTITYINKTNKQSENKICMNSIHAQQKIKLKPCRRPYIITKTEMHQRYCSWKQNGKLHFTK